jgi:hypothetical protein
MMSENPSDLDIDEVLTLPAIGCSLPYSDVQDAIKRVKVLYDSVTDVPKKKKLAAAHNHLQVVLRNGVTKN